MKLKLHKKSFSTLSKVLVMAAVVTLVNCKGKDGDPGPIGPAGAPGTPGASFEKANENGFIKGTFKGTRRDGTAFEEAFEYKTAFTPEGFEPEGNNLHSLYLTRALTAQYDAGNEAEISLYVTSKDQNPTAEFGSFAINFSKGLADRNLFYLRAAPTFVDTEISLPISRAYNETYKLIEYGKHWDYYYDQELGQSLTMVEDTEGNKIYFEDYQRNYDDAQQIRYGNFKYIINNNGEKSTTSEKFGNLRIVQPYFSGYVSFRTVSGTDLSETITIPADTQEITDFAYNASTGLVTFNYKLIINKLRSLGDRNYGDYGRNSTQNTLEITGSVSATIYNGMVLRKGMNN